MKLTAKNIRKAACHLRDLDDELIEAGPSVDLEKRMHQRIYFLEQFVRAVEAKAARRGREEENE